MHGNELFAAIQSGPNHGGACAGVWFVYHHFWFLETSVSGMPLQMLCKLALAAMLPAALLPGLVRSGGSKLHLGILLVVQVCPAVVPSNCIDKVKSPFLRLAQSSLSPICRVSEYAKFGLRQIM